MLTILTVILSTTIPAIVKVSGKWYATHASKKDTNIKETSLYASHTKELMETIQSQEQKIQSYSTRVTLLKADKYEMFVLIRELQEELNSNGIELSPQLNEKLEALKKSYTNNTPEI